MHPILCLITHFVNAPLFTNSPVLWRERNLENAPRKYILQFFLRERESEMAEKTAVEKPAAENKVIPEAEELPKAIVRRVVKDKLSQLSKDGADISVFKEALMAFSESARIFIHYLSAMYARNSIYVYIFAVFLKKISKICLRKS